MTEEDRVVTEAVEAAWQVLWDYLYGLTTADVNRIEERVVAGLRQDFASLRADRGIDISQK